MHGEGNLPCCVNVVSLRRVVDQRGREITEQPEITEQTEKPGWVNVFCRVFRYFRLPRNLSFVAGLDATRGENLSLEVST